MSTFKQEETTTRNSNEPGQDESDIDTAIAESRDGLTMAEGGIEMDVFYHGDREEDIPEDNLDTSQIFENDIDLDPIF